MAARSSMSSAPRGTRTIAMAGFYGARLSERLAPNPLVPSPAVAPVASLVVQKFGGSSVADADRMRAVADYIARTRRHGVRVVVVVSAMGKETDELLRLAAQVSNTRPGREMDMLITAGERKAMALLCMALHDLGVPADSFTGSQAGMITDNDHTRAKILEVRPDRIRE